MAKKTTTKKTTKKPASKKSGGPKKVRAEALPKAPPKAPSKARAKACPAGTEPQRTPTSLGAVVGGTDPCTCGHSPEEHGHDADYPGSTGCVVCEDGDCVAYEADPLT